MMAFLSVPTTTAASSRTNASEWAYRQALTLREAQPVQMSDRKLTSDEAWARFENDYSPTQKSSAIKRPIENVKYGLDTCVFAVDRFFKNVQNQADFSLDRGSLRHTREIPLTELLKNPRVKLDIDMGQSARPYVGVRLIIPFGK